MSFSDVNVTPDRHEFDGRVADAGPSKNLINLIILDYLTMEGYSGAAATFSQEANIAPLQSQNMIEERQAVHHHILRGEIDQAILALNRIDTQILDDDPHLHFSLLRLQMLGIVRQCTASSDGDVQPALEFATTQLSPKTVAHPEFLKELENTMALLIYPKETLEARIEEQLKPEVRNEMVNRVNEAMLRRQNQRLFSSIRQLVRMRAWAENSARKRKIPLPDDLLSALWDKDDSEDDNHVMANA